MNLALISILTIIGVFIVGSFKKNPIHIGVLAMLATYVLGKAAGIADIKIMGFFPTTLFVRLFGIMLFFAITQCNGTIEVLAKKMLSKTGNSLKIMPFFIFYIGVILASVGIPSMAGFAVYTGLAIAIAKAAGVSPQLFGIAAGYGIGCGVYSPINEYTVNILTACETAGLETNLMHIYFFCLIAYSISFLVIYLCLGGHKNTGNADPEMLRDIPAFTRAQKITIVGIVALIILVAVCKVDIGWAGFIMSVVCTLLGANEGQDAMKKVSLGSLLLVCGVGCLIALVQELGGFELMSNALVSIMTPKTVAPIMSMTSSIMSLFTISRLCVLTLVPTIPGIIEQIPEASTAFAIIATSAGATASNIGPLSICGAMIMSNIGMQYGEQEVAKYFTKEMLMGLLGASVIALVALATSYIGIFG